MTFSDAISPVPSPAAKVIVNGFVKNGLAVFLQDEDKINPFYEIHNKYIEYITRNPINLTISKAVKTELFNASNNSLRTAKYLLGLLKGYCQYLQINEPTIEDTSKFLEVFNPQFEITDIEFLVYEKLYNSLKIVTDGGDNDLDYLLNDDGSPLTDYFLLQTKNRNSKSFFTAKQIKTYFKTDFQHNKNLKDTIDQIPQILDNLYNANYLERLDYQYNGQNVYFIPYNEEMD